MKSDTATMSISLPTTMKTFIEQEVQDGGYSTPSEYLRELVRDAKRRKEDEHLEKLLLQALESPATPMTKDDWDAIKQRGIERIRQKKAGNK